VSRRWTMPRESGFQRLVAAIRLRRGKHLTACREVPSCGQQRDKLRRIGRPRGGGLIGAGGIAQPHRAGGGGDCCGDPGALDIGQATLDVCGNLRACLVVMARSLLAAGTPVVLATPRPSPLRALAGVPGVLGLFDRPELGEAELAGAHASFTGPRSVVLVDDAELLRDCGAAGEPAHCGCLVHL